MGKSEWTETGKNLVVGVGSALVDMLAHEDDAFIEKTGAVKGGMTLVDKAFIDQTLAMTSRKPRIVPGGSACNTVIGIGKLGGAARFVGKSGLGQWGTLFENDLIDNNVQPALFKSESPTGRVLSIITPDTQRSMFTFLGASSEADPEDLNESCFAGASVVHVEGYLLFNPELILAALKSAKAAGARVSLDLASFNVVEESRDFLGEIISDYVDILIANEDEARAFTGYSNEQRAIEKLAAEADIAVLKVGERGSFIAHEGNVVAIDPVNPGRAVDTTGAGDLWASGFLFGLVNGYSLEKCGEIGSACGYEVCKVIGAAIPDDGWERIKQRLP